ncbi:hypothetical protein XENTR_v10000583 [Xenopus tropicalis]|nr:toll-like receptor 3 [Xenopus tropicalis]KAE8629748.1 hypothetical protein XENTR_v10000583 [Xenopus tropicalis]
MGQLWLSLHILYAIYGMSLVAGNPCKITEDLTADCSHLKLSAIPSDLPRNIKALDLSHNQLKKLPAANLSVYDQLERLDAGFNTLHQFEPALCKQLLMLKTLNLEHNEFTKISENDFTFCVHLSELHLASNGISNIDGNPFEKLENLLFLDMSHNKMISTALGNKQQLNNLKELYLNSNKISKLNKEAFEFLANTSLQKLDLSSNPLTEINPGCFQAIGSFAALVIQNTQLDPQRTEQVCSELAHTGVRNLTLNNIRLSKIRNTTFKGLADTNLTVLDLSGNSLSQIDNDSFVSLGALEILNLENNDISHVNPKTFNGLSKVRVLNLRKSLSSNLKLDDLSFQSLHNVQYLNMEANKIISITEHTFIGLTSLTNLSLSDSTLQQHTLTNRTFLSLSKSPLYHLNLTKTGLTKIENGAFLCLKHLQLLDMGLNQIDQEVSGNELEGLANIEMIYLSYNRRITLTSNSFIFAPSLSKLYLRKTALTFRDLNPSPFKVLQNLTVLDLSNNNIANIQEDVFESLSNLRILSFEHNNLARLWKEANPGGPVLFLKGLKNLEKLSLLSNGFDEIPANAFKGLCKLKVLDIGENNVYILPPSVFDDQHSLTLLDLHKNLITSVEQDLFKNVFSSLKYLNMGGNPYDCTCESIAWFASWLNTTNTSVPLAHSQYICNTPARYHGNPVDNFDSSPCKELAPFRLFVSTFSLMLVFILSVLLIQFQGWRIHFYWTVSINRILGFKEIDPRKRNFDYDAYIIHAQNDVSWVENHLIPLEKNAGSKLQFCFEERDLEAGTSTLSAFVDCINRSRKIIFVVTRNLLNDSWCRRFKVQHAFQQAIEQNRDSIILIFLEDIPDYKLYHTIHLRRGMFKSRCILDWPDQMERIKTFYQRLKIALGSTNLVNLL